MKIKLIEKRYILLSVVPAAVLLSASPAAAQPEIEGDPLLRAMRDELKRSVDRLVLSDAQKPYFIEYFVRETDRHTISASFGAVLSNDRHRSRDMHVTARVGDYDFDNTGYRSVEDMFGGGDREPSSLVLEDDYEALRHDLWLATDFAYKRAIEQLANKRAALENKVEEEKIPDFSREEATVRIAPRRAFQVDTARWARQVREWSAIFRKYPAIQSSGVTLTTSLDHRYVMNSEGTTTRQPATLVTLTVRAGTQAEDGMKLSRSVPFHGRTFEDLPSAAEITAAVAKLADELTTLRAAPTLADPYSGPVLFTGEASAQMFARVLTPNLSGERPPMTDNRLSGFGMGSSRSIFADRMKRPVADGNISVYDDPTMERYGDRALIGSYAVDEQGIPARRISLIENGILKELLMSRRPTKSATRSNGHGRTSGLDIPSVAIGNLVVEAEDGISYNDLKGRLIEMCRTQELPYGILVRSLRTESDRDVVIFVNGIGAGGAQTLPALAAYRIYPDGREELIRGAEVKDLTPKSLREIVAVGSDPLVHNTISVGGGPGEGGVPTSIIAPSVLFMELEVKNGGGTQTKPALLSHPFFGE